VGTTKSYLSMIENHRVSGPPSRQLLERVEQALGFVAGELVRAADWQNTPAGVREEVRRLQEQALHGAALARWLRDRAGDRPEGGKDLDELFRSGELGRRVSEVLTGEAAQGGEAAQAAGLAPRRAVAYRVPLVNKVAAGYPRDFTDLDYPARVADSYIPAPDVEDPLAFAATVVGDSMLPEYRQGDIIIFSPAAPVADGADCFVRLEPDHQTTFKRVFFEEGGQVRLQPLNPRFPASTLPRDGIAGLYRAVARYQRL
jgi:phage repressor protein C with HTH and peptisase S24 domain